MHLVRRLSLMASRLAQHLLGMPEPTAKARTRASVPHRQGRGGGRGRGEGAGEPGAPPPIAPVPPPVDPPPGAGGVPPPPVAGDPPPPVVEVGEPPAEESFAAVPLPAPRRASDDVRTEVRRTHGIGDCDISWNLYLPTVGAAQPHFKCHCRNPDHGRDCEKRRGDIPQFKRRFGDIECIAYLQAWHEIAWPTSPDKLRHAQENPGPVDTARWAMDHAEELRAVLSRLGR